MNTASRISIVLSMILTSYIACGQSDSVVNTRVSQPIFDSTAIAIPEEEVEDYYAPDNMGKGHRNPIYYFGHDFCTVFFQFNIVAGSGDFGFGFDAAYVPEVWGGFISTQMSIHYYWVAAGAEYRLSSPWNKTDWHIYAGIAGRTRGENDNGNIGCEAGFRVAANSLVTNSKLSMISGSAGLRVTSDGLFLVCGMSVGISAITLF